MVASLENHLFNSLLARQEARGNSPLEPELAGTIWLHTDLGPSFYLTRDGSMFVTDAFGDSPPRPANPDEVCAGLVLGARNLDCVALLDLLPAPPNNAVVCTRCRGERWARLHPDLDRLVICVDCAGRGWSLEHRQTSG